MGLQKLFSESRGAVLLRYFRSRREVCMPLRVCLRIFVFAFRFFTIRSSNRGFRLSVGSLRVPKMFRLQLSNADLPPRGPRDFLHSFISRKHVEKVQVGKCI